jgi:hypothetical protein
MYDWLFNDTWYARCWVRKDRWFWVVFDSFGDLIFSHASVYGYERTAAEAEARARQAAGPGAQKGKPGDAKRLLDVWRLGIANPRPGRLPPWCAALGLPKLPRAIDEVKAAYRRCAKASHPDAGGTAAEFMAVESAYRDAMAYCQRCGLTLAS